MLTYKQQKFMLKLFVRKKLCRKDALDMFSNDSDFFHQIKLLRECGFLINKDIEKNRVEYRLSYAGWIFANFLAWFDADYEKYAKSGLPVWLG